MQTYLFSDIESSTRLWEEHPEDMADALARHDAIFSSAIEHAGGRLVKSTGDGGFAVFSSASSAVTAALESQKALANESWGATGPIRVRMGIHSGDSEIRDGDIFGPAVNRAARIMAAGHGGQVLMSGLTANLASETLPEGASLREMGVHRLKDLTLPEDLHQLVFPDLPSDFPTLLTLDSRPHNLPLQTTEFLGRTNELAAISVMLESPNIRLLTIAGPGGAGKTRIGLQVAADQFDKFKDGVFFVDLSLERDPDAAFEAVVRALNLPASGGGALEVLRTRLRDKEMLLLLDNFEQVTAAAPGLAELLQHAPKLKVIVTSRETLRIRAEYVFPVPPLSLPHPNDPVDVIIEAEAVQLFIERAQSVVPGFEATQDNAATVAEICLRLDGLPLAIELAAARLNVFSPSDLLTRLRQRLDILSAGGRDVPDRQRTLWGAIGWSYELLDDRERDLFELMAVFSSTGIDAIEAVAVDAFGEFDIDSLGSLVDKSLVQSDDSGNTRRFSMLLMIKEYSEERLALSDSKQLAARSAHARYFSSFAQGLEDRLTGADRDAAVEELASEIGNLRTAWRFWVDQADVERLFNLIDGLWALHEARGWYHAAIELATDTLKVLTTTPSTPELAAEELVIRTSLARAVMAVRGYGVEVEEAFRDVLRMADASGTSANRFPVLRALFFYHMNKGEMQQAHEISKELLAMGEADVTMRVDGHYTYGLTAVSVGELEEGLRHLDRAIELYDPKRAGRYRLGTSVGVGARVFSGLTLWQCGALETAVDRVTEALELAYQLDHPFSIAWALYHNGFLALSRYRFEESCAFAERLAKVADENDYLLWRTLATVLNGVSTTALGDVERGREMTEAAIDLYQGLTTPPIFWPLILGFRAQVFALSGQIDKALPTIEEAITLTQDNPAMLSPFLVLKGDFHRVIDPERAKASYLQAATSASSAQLNTVELQALTGLVSLQRDLGETPDDRDRLERIYARFTEGFDELDLVRAQQVLDT